MFIHPAIAISSVVSIPSGISVLATAVNNSNFDPLSLIGTTVTPVIVILLLLTGKLHTDGEFKRIVAENEAYKIQIDARNKSIEEKIIPALTKTTLVLENVTPMLDPRFRPPSGSG